MRGASQASAVLSASTSGSTARGSAMRASARSAISRTSPSSVRVAWMVSSSAGTAFALPDAPQQLGGECALAPLPRAGELRDVLVDEAEAVVRVEQPRGPLGRAARLLLEGRLEGFEVEQRVQSVDLGLEQRALTRGQLGHESAVHAFTPRRGGARAGRGRRCSEPGDHGEQPDGEHQAGEDQDERERAHGPARPGHRR